jgi:hypothetical protein
MTIPGMAVSGMDTSGLDIPRLDKRRWSSALQRFLQLVGAGKLCPSRLGDTFPHPRIPPLDTQSKGMVERGVLGRKVTGVIPKRGSSELASQ